MFSGHWNQTGSWNTFLGFNAGCHNTSGSKNTFIGYGSGFMSQTCSDNTFLGWNAGYYNTTGKENTFLGAEAGYNNTANWNTFVGYNAGRSNKTGALNTFLGDEAGFANTTGKENTFIGYRAGYANIDGSDNTFLGQGAGASNTAGSANVFLGFEAGYNEKGSNRLYIDNSNTATPLVHGEFDNDILTVNGKVWIGTRTRKIPQHPLEIAGGAYTDGTSWIDVSSREHKADIEELGAGEALEAMRRLKPVKYAYKVDRTERRVGFIAEEVPELVAMKDRTGLSAMDIVAVLTKVVQGQQRAIEEQQRMIQELTEKVIGLEREL